MSEAKKQGSGKARFLFLSEAKKQGSGKARFLFLSKLMKPNGLRQKSKSELQKLLQEDRERLRSLRFDLASGKVKNVREVRKVKKDIAKILTLLH